MDKTHATHGSCHFQASFNNSEAGMHHASIGKVCKSGLRHTGIKMIQRTLQGEAEPTGAGILTDWIGHECDSCRMTLPLAMSAR